jgi:hypothetical protein
MVTFLLTVAVLSAFIIVGYSLNMYLYARGVTGISARALRQMSSLRDEPFLLEPVYIVGQRERDYGLRYARVGILLIASILVALVVGLMVALSAVLH